MRNAAAWTLLAIFAACSENPEPSRNGQHASHDAAATEQQEHVYGEKLGTVRFPVSCNETAKPHMERGLALLHHMTYEGAEQEFAAATQADPECALGYWGQAMTYIHPLWSDPPETAMFEKGRELVEKAKPLAMDEREQAYVAAVEAYYSAGQNAKERTNLESFEKGWEKVYQQFPEDLEAACFYALAHMATADPSDKTFAKQRRAGEIAEKVLKEIPDHPAGHHYLIHAYDYPPLAVRALQAARSYGDIAPHVPHALHMPSHIFTRLGLWEELIAWNKRSAAAAVDHPAGDAVSMHYLHALDYMVYAYLQRAEDQEAERVLSSLKELEGPLQIEVAVPYTLAAVPARIALERQQWANAAGLKPRTPSDFPWDKFPAMEAITHFARALGAARTGDEKTAREAIDMLASLKEKAEPTSAYWANQVEIQRQTAMAWLQFQSGKKDEGLKAMRKAAEMEAATEKHPVTPGEVLPARELLADMLLEMNRPKEAQEEYEAALKRSPNRFNSLYGAARAAELAGASDKAAEYYGKLVELTTSAETGRERLKQARAYMASN